MVERHLPALLGAGEDEGVTAAGVAAAFGGALEVEAAQHPGMVLAERMDFHFGEGEAAHGGGRGVSLQIALERGFKAARDLLADEGEFGRVEVLLHESAEVAAIPSRLLPRDDRFHGGLHGRRWGGQQRDPGEGEGPATAAEKVHAFHDTGFAGVPSEIVMAVLSMRARRPQSTRAANAASALTQAYQDGRTMIVGGQ